MSDDSSTPKPKPEIIVFDLGKVLVDFDYSLAGKRLAARSKISPEAIQEYLDHSPLLFRYESGQMTRQEFFEEVRRYTGFAGTLTEFGRFFADIFKEMPEMIGIHDSLYRRGFRTFILSNTNDLAIEHIRASFPFFANFNGYILSYEVGAMKPNPVIYAALEARTGFQKGQILYIDDRQENIVAAEERGWNTILQTTPAATRAAMAQFDLIV